MQVRKAIAILEQHGIAHANADTLGRVYYKSYVNDVLRLVRSARCALTAKTLYGEIAEAIIEELIAQGRLACSDCLKRVSTRLELGINQAIFIIDKIFQHLSGFDEVKIKFARLAESQFVIRCPQLKPAEEGDDAEPPKCPIFQPLNNPFSMPDSVASTCKF